MSQTQENLLNNTAQQQEESNADTYLAEGQNKNISLEEEQKKLSKHKIENTFSLINLRNLLPAELILALAHKSDECTHHLGCIDHVYTKAVRGFLYGYFGHAGLSVLQCLKKKQPKLIFNSLISMQSLKFSMFLIVWNLGVNMVTCAVRNFCEMKKFNEKEKKQIHFLAGFIAGFCALATQPVSSRKIWTIFTLTRAFDFTYNSLVNKGILKKQKQFYTVLFSFLNIVTVYAYANEPSQVAMAINRFYDFVFNPGAADNQHLIMCMKHRYRDLSNKGINADADLVRINQVYKKIQDQIAKGHL